MIIHLPEGDAIKYPETEIERAGWEARWIVSRGLRDVVDWAGVTRIPRNPRNIALRIMHDTQPLLGDTKIPYQTVFPEDMSGR